MKPFELSSKSLRLCHAATLAAALLVLVQASQVQAIDSVQDRFKMALRWEDSAGIKQEAGDFRGAIAEYSKALALDPSLLTCYYNRGVLYECLDLYNDALADYQSVLDRCPRVASAYAGRANVKAHFGDTRGALQDYRLALLINPKEYYACVDRAELENKLGDKYAAVADLTQAIGLKPKEMGPRRDRGELWQDLGETNKAIADFTYAVAFDSRDAEALRLRGTLLSRLQHAEGMRDLDEALKIEPNDSAVVSDHGFGLMFMHRWSDALVDFNRVVMLRPENGCAYNARGMIKEVLCDFKGALQDYDRSLELKNEYSHFYFQRARCHYKSWQPLEACADYFQGFSIDFRQHFGDFISGFIDSTAKFIERAPH